jgi:hypothetical protein
MGVMSKAATIYDGLKYIYAEQLKGKQVTLTIKSIENGVKFVDARGVKAVGFDIHFKETDKVLGVAGSTVRRQIFAATGEDETDKLIGKKITLYPVESAKSATGQAIRIRINQAQPKPAPEPAADEPADDGLEALM